MDKIELRDNREPGWFWVDNVIVKNYGLTTEALAIYSDIASHANNNTQKAYFALNAFCERFRVGKAKARRSLDLLIDRGLIRIAGKNSHGCPVVEMLSVDKDAFFKLEKGKTRGKKKVVLISTGGGSKKNLNKTNKQDLRKRGQDAI